MSVSTCNRWPSGLFRVQGHRLLPYGSFRQACHVFSYMDFRLLTSFPQYPQKVMTFRRIKIEVIIGGVFGCRWRRTWRAPSNMATFSSVVLRLWGQRALRRRSCRPRSYRPVNSRMSPPWKGKHTFFIKACQLCYFLGESSALSSSLEQSFFANIMFKNVC